MHLNTRDIVLDAWVRENKISIENSIFQLENVSNDVYQITLAWGEDVDPIRSPEDDLLDATREAMHNGDDWSVGCSTVRKNAWLLVPESTGFPLESKENANLSQDDVVEQKVGKIGNDDDQQRCVDDFSSLTFDIIKCANTSSTEVNHQAYNHGDWGYGEHGWTEPFVPFSAPIQRVWESRSTAHACETEQDEDNTR